MKQKLWRLAFVLASLKTGLDFFHGITDGDGTLGAQGQPSVSTQINLATPQFPMCGSIKYFSHDPVKEPYFHQEQLQAGHLTHQC